MKAKNISKRVLSVILCTVMLFSCWVFTAPQADAATAGSYYYSFSVTTTDNGDSNDSDDANNSYIQVFGKPTNGTGTEASIKSQYVNADDYWQKKNSTVTMSGTSNSFPTKVKMSIHFDWNFIANRSWKGNYSLKVGSSASNATEILSGSWSLSGNNATKTAEASVDSSKYPYTSSITEISGDSTVAVPTKGGTTTKTYTAGTVKDQYGVNWYQNATLSATSVPNDCSFENNVLSVPHSANRASNYTCKIKQSCGSASNEKSITIQTFDYNVKFYQENGTTQIGSTQTVDYGKSAEAPTAPDKAQDDYRTYQFDKWTGDTYTTLKTGKQERKVTATYKQKDAQVYTITYKNGDYTTDLLVSSPGYEGSIAPPATASKAPTPEYNYKFAGWATEGGETDDGTSDKRVNITNATTPKDLGMHYNTNTKTYYPWFSREKNKYNVTFNYKVQTKVEGVDTVVDADPVVRANQEYGTTPTAPENMPTTLQSVDQIWRFSGWDITVTNVAGTNTTTDQPAITTVTGTTTYTAKYSKVPRPYKITFRWKNPDNESEYLSSSGDVAYGTFPTAPQAASIPNYTTPMGEYSFREWSPAVKSVEGIATYTAQYDCDPTDYTLTYYDDDGKTVLAAPTYNWNSNLSAPATPSKSDDAQYTYTFAGWKVDDTQTVVQNSYFTENQKKLQDLGGNHYYTATYEPHLRYYTITYLESDGSVYKVVENVAYGTVPAEMTGEDAVPALKTREPDPTNHYTSDWDKDINTGIIGPTEFRIIDTPEKHENYWVDPAGTVIKEPTCVEKGTLRKTCSKCNHSFDFDIDIAPNAHAWQRDTIQTHSPDKDVYIYYYCTNGCGNYAGATYSETTGYKVDKTKISTDVSEAASSSPGYKTPEFNVFTDESLSPKYDYSEKKASLRTRRSEMDPDVPQAMRFSGNLYAFNLYESGIRYAADPAKLLNGNNYRTLEEIENDKSVNDCIVDFGFVYSQSWRMLEKDDDGNYVREGNDYVLDMNNLVLGAPAVSRMSVVKNNADKGAFNEDHNTWSGVTYGGMDQFTFNLVIGVQNYNWKITYVARTYVIYKYRGDLIVVYDTAQTNSGDIVYSHDSVYNQADKLIKAYPSGYINEYMTKKIKYYCDEKFDPYPYFSDWNVEYKVKSNA